MKRLIFLAALLPLIASADPIQDCHSLTTSPAIEQCHLHNIENHLSVIRQNTGDFRLPTLASGFTANESFGFNWFFSGHSGDYDICFMEVRRIQNNGSTPANYVRNVVGELNINSIGGVSLLSETMLYELSMECSESPPASGCNLSGATSCVVNPAFSFTTQWVGGDRMFETGPRP